jgi:phosphohistidine swiveling domain-containing protein
MVCSKLSSALDNNQAGSKAANLAKALALGMRVPPGFVIYRPGLRLFLKESGLLGRVSRFLQGDTAQEHSRLQQPFEELCGAVLEAPFPQALKLEIGPLASELLSISPAGLAVRSSAACEDTLQASFAGIFASYLGIVRLDDLWDKIRRVWCSAWSPQACRYAHRMGIELQPDHMAVIVQVMSPAESAGVIFTAHPLSGNPYRFVLNATCGLAQRLVDGRAPADRFVLAWDTGRVLEKEIADKPTALEARPEGVVEMILSEKQRAAPALTDSLAEKIARLALDLDRAFDQRLDIEWAVDNGEIDLLQARPITALPVYFPHQLSAEEAEWSWTPEERAWYSTIAANERLVAPLFRQRWALELWERWSAPGDAFPHKRGHERDFNGYRYTTEWTWYNHGHDRASTEAWLDEHEPSLRAGWLAQLERPHQANRQAAELQARTVHRNELVPALLAFIEQEEVMQVAVWHAPQWLVFTCEDLLKALLDEAAPGFPIGDLLQGLPCYSSQRTIAAQELGRSIEEDFVKAAFAGMTLTEVIPWLVQEHPECQFVKDFEAFCWEFGMAPPCLPMPWARWGQEPAQSLFIIKSSALGQAQDARKVLAGCTRQRQLSEAQARQCIRQLSPALVERFDKLLGWAQFWTPALDDRKWHCAMGTRMAGLLQKAGDLLAREDIWDQPADILLLTPQALAQMALEYDVSIAHQIYLACRQEYERNRRLAPPPFLVKPPVGSPSPTLPPAVSIVIPGPGLAGAKVFKGQGFAPGRTTGIIRKVPNLNDPGFLDTLTGEDILVCPEDSDNDWWRRDWLALFMVVRGLVTVQGAHLHHATQIARECGVPFINLPGVDYASLPDNTRVELDGSAGTVTLLQETDVPQWAPRVKQSLIRRLYELDAGGILDEELIDEAGWALYERCQSFIAAVEAVWGRVKCPACGETIQYTPGPGAMLLCPGCRWQMPWQAYFRTIQHKQLSGDAAVVAMFQDYIQQFPKANEPRQKMVLIDQLIHGFHENLQSGPRRAVAVNLIEGRFHEVVAFLDRLSYGEGSTLEIQKSRDEWRRKIDYAAEK